jgi:glycine/D-amino acid oxidase-like deaminating enzyme
MSIPTGNPPKQVIIVGAGVVGTSTAYYLSHLFGISSTLVDPSGRIAPAASGKAGGFLALDWNDHSVTGQLARRSFALHQELANTLGAEKLQYRRLTCAAIRVDPTAKPARPSGKKLEFIEWANDGGSGAALGARPLGDEDTIAQVHPKKLCDALWEVVSKTKQEGGVGATLVKGKVIGTSRDECGNLVGVKLDDGTIVEGDAVLFSAGPWTANVMTGIKYHSVIIPTDRTLSQCVFFSGAGDPEVYVRPDNTAYCCGFPDQSVKVMEEPGEEEVRPAAVQRIVEAVRAATGGTETGGALAADPELAQSCYLPSTTDGLPIMGRLSEQAGGGDGCFIATGHGCWGILMGPATGESMATLIATGNDTDQVDLSLFTPSRFRNMRVLESLSQK